MKTNISSYWSNEEFIEVVKNAISIWAVLLHFGCPKNQGHYYRLFHKSVQELHLDISHLKKHPTHFYKKIPTN